MKLLPSILLGLALATQTLTAQSEFWDQAVGLLSEGKLDEASALTELTLAERPEDPDALVIAGTVLLYQRVEYRRDDSIFRPEVSLESLGELELTPEGADAVAALWRRVPSKDPGRSYLWGDLAQLTYRTGDTARALDYARSALAEAAQDPAALHAAALVFALNLDWAAAAKCLALIPGERMGLLYQGLDAWRTGKDGWRVPLKDYLSNPGAGKDGSPPAGVALATFLTGPNMRDNETGFQEAIRVEDSLATLAVRQKYVERYPDKFQPRLELARSLSQHASFARALFHYSEIDRKGLATTPEQRLAVLFQEAWAHQGAGHHTEANRLWALVADARDFYLKSAACWFLGEAAARENKPEEATQWWTRVASEPARSKYAYWCSVELKKLPR